MLVDEFADKASPHAEGHACCGVCHAPPGAPQSTRLDGDIIELGMGIHGEPGRKQISLPLEGAGKLSSFVRSIQQ